MKTYRCTVPIVGYFHADVVAENPQAAIDQALGLDFLLADNCDLGELDAVRSLGRGNYSVATIQEASTKEIEADDE